MLCIYELYFSHVYCVLWSQMKAAETMGSPTSFAITAAFANRWETTLFKGSGQK